MQLIFGPKEEIQHFMCPLANNWPPKYYAPHYYATDLGPKRDIQHFNVFLPTISILIPHCYK
jgi:hypothetical protein